MNFRSALEAPPAPGRDLPRTPLKKTDDNAQDFKEPGMYVMVNGGKIFMISCLIFFIPKMLQNPIGIHLLNLSEACHTNFKKPAV